MKCLDPPTLELETCSNHPVLGTHTVTVDPWTMSLWGQGQSRDRGRGRWNLWAPYLIPARQPNQDVLQPLTFCMRELGTRKAAFTYLTGDKTGVQTGGQQGRALGQAIGVLLPSDFKEKQKESMPRGSPPSSYAFGSRDEQRKDKILDPQGKSMSMFEKLHQSLGVVKGDPRHKSPQLKGIICLPHRPLWCRG